jgi:drug/metabolite transporter (DMT)-like permease
VTLPGLVATVRQRRADALLSVMVLIWGFHFIVAKDAIAAIEPLTYNALRFLVGLPAVLIFAALQKSALRLSRRDLALVTVLTLTGPVLYQIGFVLGLKRTTSTNTALLIATLPTWTALFSIALGMVEIRWRLLAGVALTLIGVALVVLSGAEDGLALSHDDLVGSGLVLGAAVAGGLANVLAKPVVDRMGGLPLGIWKYILTALTLSLLAGPKLLTLSAEQVPAANIPNILYSGMLAGAGGFLVTHLAIREIGPTRSSSYFNFNPIVAALAGVLILHEPFSGWLLLGGALSVLGVMMVNHNTYLRRSVPAAEPLPHAPVVSPVGESTR